MGMFDEYEPQPVVVCPYCAATLSGWQGKDGPCALFVWRQGFASPVNQRGDDGCLPDEKRARFRLPLQFGFYTNPKCRFCPQFAVGQTENGVWITTTLWLLSDAPYHEQVDLNEDHAFNPHSWRRNEG